MGENVRADYHAYPAPGHCIYCGTTEGKLSREHIVPYALNGGWSIAKASCEECAKITTQYERACLNVLFKPLRTRLKMWSRRPKQEMIDVAFVDRQSGERRVEQVHHPDFPVSAFGLHLPVAGILAGKPPSDTTFVTFQFRFYEGELERYVAEHREIVRIATLDPTAFMRMLAKIGYSYAAAERAVEGLHPMLVDLVLARPPNSAYLPYLVGGDEAERNITHDCHNRIELWDLPIRESIFTIVKIQLFGSMGLPTYHVVVGERPATQSRR